MNGTERLLLVGSRGGTHIGASLERAAIAQGVPTQFLDTGTAFAAARPLRTLSWRLLGHRPPRLRRFSSDVVSLCHTWLPEWIIATGLAPVEAWALAELGAMGVRRVNYLTDDPWNPTFRSQWFFDALREYDHIFSPRQANLDDLANHGCAAVSYLEFGFDPTLWLQPADISDGENARLAADVVFVGGADADRLPYIEALLGAGFSVALYGAYWERYRSTRRHHRGQADVQTISKATRAAKVALCLARRANRDGHVMRSLEIAAIGACMLVEDTLEHRRLFGASGERVVYFSSEREMIERLAELLSADTERRRLASAVREHILAGNHTYADRLKTMLGDSVAAASTSTAVAGR